MKDPNPPQRSGLILVTGCPRSGTRFFSESLETYGIRLGHELAGKHGTVEWRHAATKDPAFDVKISLARHPIRTITSLTDLMIANYKNHRAGPTWYYIEKIAWRQNFHQFIEREMWVEAATFWWNSVYAFHIAEGYRSVRVEDIAGDPINNHSKPHALNIDKDWVWAQVQEVAGYVGYRRKDKI